MPETMPFLAAIGPSLCFQSTQLDRVGPGGVLGVLRPRVVLIRAMDFTLQPWAFNTLYLPARQKGCTVLRWNMSTAVWN